MDIAVLKYQKIRELSPSSRGTYRSCPRKYELAKLSSGGWEDTIHTVFGKAVGAGIQQWFAWPAGGEYIRAEQIISANLSREASWKLAVFIAWRIPLWERDSKKNKSFGWALNLVEKFINDCENGELPFKDWKYIGAEVGFRIKLPDGFRYRGFIDLVLCDPNGLPAVIELKTTGSKWSSKADWQNADQGNSYSLVLPNIVPGAQRYLMVYVVGLSYGMNWVAYDFVKGDQEKLDFVQDLLADIKVIKFFETLPRFPMHGNACHNFGRECEWLGICHLANERLINPESVKVESQEDGVYEYEIDFENLGG